ncbi:Scr1 family TA system antitoxin-like transcriptional regulator [Actinoplanes sp. G11-F43]|uniref:Scr1 family TA system antitoxin-like transcriptional regulator n=1 Tax=Actinoplanes sp. G11-F43 TaxID=3424130 RepID=UPI003D348CD5
MAKRQLRLTLRLARLNAKRTQAEVAEELDWSPSKIMRIENGQVGVQTSDLMALLTQYPSLTEQTKKLIELARLSRRPTVASRYRDVLTKDFAEWLGYEAYATAIRQYETKFVPGVLQTDDYATGIVNGLLEPGVAADLADRIVNARFERAAPLLGPEGPKMAFIVDEGVLHRWVGNENGSRGFAGMRAQINHLRRLNTRGRRAAGETIEPDLNPNISIQVVPLRLGAYRALRGPFEIIEFEERDLEPMLYFENPEGDVVIKEDGDEVARYADLFASLKETVPPDVETGAILDSVIRSVPELS